MKNKFLLISLIGAILIGLLCNCEEKESSDILLFVDPDKNYIKIEKNDRIDFTIKCESNKKIRKFRMGTKSSDFAIDYFFDTTINQNNFNINYPYTVPKESTQDEITVVFAVENVNNKEKKLAKRIMITKADTLLNETTGHTLYSNLSEEADGYNLLQNKAVYTNYSDSSDIHIYDLSTDSIHGNNLSRRWETMTSVNFVKFNDFDYSNATNVSLKEAYNSGVKKEFVANIQTEDIIIANINDDTLVAIKITGVYDPDSTQDDRYIFNMKK
jgi:hypothetical protein